MASRGFSVIEVLIALALLSVAVLGGVQLVVMAIEAMGAARSQSLSAVLASARLEDLRGLTFDFDELGVRSTDVQTDLSTTPRTLAGTGLATGGSITANVAGFVDHLDARGGWVGTGPDAPPTAAFTRRWSISPGLAVPDLLVVEVVVFRVATRPTAAAGRYLPGSAYMVTVFSRRQR